MNADRQNSIIFNLALISILCLSAFLRIYHLDFQSLWIDEVNTMVQARPDQSFMDTYRGLSMDLQPPLYFYILKFLFKVFGYSTVVMRSFSAVLGIAGIFSIFLLGREMAGRRAGLYAAILLCFNYFHIYYSQEARPYSFLFLFTCLSFLSLIRFLKQPSYKKALSYGIFSALMLYGHPYGIFSLFAQGLILATCFFQTSTGERWIFFKQVIAGYAVTILLFLPALPLFMTAAKVRDFWIQAPGTDIFSALIRDFFGGSEFLFIPAYLLILTFILNAFRSNENDNFLSGIRKGNTTSTLILLIVWIVICVLIPLIRSYTHVPMIVSRYLTGILPAIILLVSLGLSSIPQRSLRVTILGLLIILSFTDLFIIKNYYFMVKKSQLREVSNGVKDNYIPGTLIVSDLWWHYSFFLDRKTYHITEMPPVQYIHSIMESPDSIKPFWYINGHNFNLENLSVGEKKFLTDNFYPDLNLNFHDAVGVYFVPKKRERTVVDLSEFKPMGSNGREFIFLYNASSTHSKPIHLPKGKYTLYLEGRSEPEEPANGINAHITININGGYAGGVFLKEKLYPTPGHIRFSLEKDQDISVELVYDNDLMLDNKDRNAFIYSVYLEKED